MARILIIDNDIDIQLSITTILEENGHSVFIASNGIDGLMFLCTNEKPELVLLDLMMPVMNGWDFLKLKNSYLTLQNIPVIVISAHLSADKKLENLAVLKKPLDLDMLLCCIENQKLH